MKHRVRQRAIFALLDGRLERKAASELERHLAECSECRDFYEEVSAAQGMLRGLNAQSPPPVNWDRVDAGLEAGLAAQRPKPLFGGLVLWGSLATATAAAFLITWFIASPNHDTRGPAAPSVSSPVATKTTAIETPTPRDEPRSVTAYVTYTAGQVGISLPGGSWQSLSLESPVEIGTNLRTSERGSAGIQLGPAHACRLQNDTEVQIKSLSTPRVSVELDRGEIVCSSTASEDSPPLVLAVMDVVASAEGTTRFSVRRRPHVVVVELAEGTLHVDPDGADHQLVSPGRYVLRRDAEGTLVAEAGDGESDSLELPDVPTLPRRTIASLQIPEIERVQRVNVDGIDYGPLPLNIRRPPGTARLQMFVEGQDPIEHEITIGLGPRVLEVASLSLGPANEPISRRGPSERRVAPRIGTYSKTQVRRLRSVVGQRVRSCYERALKRNPSIWGRINVRFTVSTSGEPRRVQVKSLSGGSGDVNRCIETGLDRQQFPAPVGGHVPIEQTITLSPQF